MARRFLTRRGTAGVPFDPGKHDHYAGAPNPAAADVEAVLALVRRHSSGEPTPFGPRPEGGPLKKATGKGGGMKEGTPAEEALDRGQAKAAKGKPPKGKKKKK